MKPIEGSRTLTWATQKKKTHVPHVVYVFNNNRIYIKKEKTEPFVSEIRYATIVLQSFSLAEWNIQWDVLKLLLV